MSNSKSLCVYCGSSVGADPRYARAAEVLGRSAARRSLRIVFGGGRVGLMGKVADAALNEGGEVIGVIPEFLETREVGHRGLTRLEVVESMHSRKMRMFDLSDAFCILPGGFGTLDEVIEVITWKQLSLHDKPIFLLNLRNYWAPFLAMVRHQVEAGFIRPQHEGLFTVIEGVEELLDAVATAPPAALEGDSRLL